MNKDGGDYLLIVVDSEDRPLGLETKWRCHDPHGILHRAFALMVFNEKGELLVSEREGPISAVDMDGVPGGYQPKPQDKKE